MRKKEKMRRFTKILLHITCIWLPVVFVMVYYSPWIYIPTHSSPYTLTLIETGYPSLKRIIVRHYMNNLHIDDYVLDLKIGIRNQKLQKYVLPEISEGEIEIIAVLEDGVTYENDCELAVKYDDIIELKNKGLLVYLLTDFKSGIYIGDFIYYDQFVCFISGEKKTVFVEKAGSSEWEYITEIPLLKKFVRKTAEYSPIYYGWKENKWEKKASS